MPLPEDEVFSGSEIPPVQKPSLENYRDHPEETPEEAELNQFELKTNQPRYPNQPKGPHGMQLWALPDGETFP